MRNHPTSSRDLSGFLVADDRFVKVDVGVAPCGMWDRDIWRDWQTKRFEVIQCEIRNDQNSARLRSTEHRHSLTMGEWTWMEVKLQDVRAECKRSEVFITPVNRRPARLQLRPPTPSAKVSRKQQIQETVQWNSAASLHTFPVSVVKKSCCCGIHRDRMSRLMECWVFFCSDLIWFVCNKITFSEYL